ncbi:hypothetical protein HP546_09390 [Pseudomonas sp. CM25]|uniref:hypothetical protein n=1 Tax=Pseudomonas sp. CM25 TaxID=2738448 RepID=UPI001556E9AC|nr:hypothetical protein [Pseudomonas sp. CM25]NQD55558.1 hypothetical protein [Pseudomonas sp. CM25]
MSLTLRCLKCDGKQLVQPIRLHRKSLITCRGCGAISHHGDLVEAAGLRLMAKLKQQLKAG